MAKMTGKNAIFVFAATTYACLQDITIDGANNISSEECSTDGTGNADVNNAPGANTWTVAAVALADADNATELNALLPGTQGTLDAYQFGNSSGRTKHAWTVATVASLGSPSATGTMGKRAVTFNCDGDPTITSIA